jgi:hypothetical protein
VPSGETFNTVCTVLDRFEQPSTGTYLGVIDAGVGRLTTQNRCNAALQAAFPALGTYEDCDLTDSAGQADFTFTTAPGEEGQGTFVVEILQWPGNAVGGTCGGQRCGDLEDNPGPNDPVGDVDDPCDQQAGRLSGEEGGAADNSPGTPSPAGNCHDTVPVTFESQEQCSDTIDNDGDGFTDHPDDPGCTDPSDTSEQPNPQCSDGVDNDGDGNIDANDAGCSDGGTYDKADDDESSEVKPPKRVDSDITAGHNNSGNSPFFGTVDSSKRKCEKRRRVIVKKVGKKRTVGKDRTNRFGNWRAEHGPNLKDGNYKAKVRKKTFTNKKGRRIICRADRSVRFFVSHG